MSVTVRDIARSAGVSVATVSRALRDLPGVKPGTRDLVLQTADRLNYAGTPAAATLSTGITQIIGIITPYIPRWSFAEMLAGMEARVRLADRDLLVRCVGDPSEPEHRRPHVRLRGRVDGFIALSLAPDSLDLREVLSLGMPTTLIGAQAPGAGCVMIDDRGAAATATRHLIGLGHRAIGLIYGRETENPLALEHERVLGFRDALSHSGLESRPEWAVPGGFTVEGGRRAMAQLLQLPDPPSAVFAFSDEMALGALAALRERGLTPGREVSVVGFDGHDLADLAGLTTVVQPLRRIGELAAEITCAAIDRRTLDISAHVLPTTLVARSSTGPVSVPELADH